MTVLIDSDILIEVSRVRDSAILAAWRAGDHELLARLFDCFVCVSVDQGIGRRAGDFLRDYARSHGLDLGDALIAATASVQNAELRTRNRKHYPMKGLSFLRPDLSRHQL